MKENLTEVVFILDRSGSMSGLESDTIGGFNAMIEKQRKGDGEALISTVLFNDHAHSLTNVDRVHTVNLDGADLLVRVMLNNTHGLGLTLHQGARSHHFGHVQAAAIFTAEAAESLIGHAGHRGENHGSINGQFAQFQGRKGKTGCFRIHPYIVAHEGKLRTGLS